jgi:phosphatidylethanolamine/phosphatidyl-N-methylethanolamine N-methyltransferase
VTIADLLYGPLSPLYDVICGALLQPGRRRAIALLDPRPGERILEVGAGSGYNINGYPPGCEVLAVDLSRSMLTRAKSRVDASHRHSVRFAQMDAQHLALPSGAFDAVLVPYTINVLPDPLAAGHEIVRVCHPRGRIVFLNHFDDMRDSSNLINRMAGRLAAAADVNWQLQLQMLVTALRLRVRRAEPVNVPRLSSVVLCERIGAGG